MSGEYFSTCATCGGAGKQTVGTTSIGNDTQLGTERCHACGGTGRILGISATLQDIQAYASERCEVSDQIFALAKQIPTRGIKQSRKKKVKRTRQVGGFLGIGSHTETYEVEETVVSDDIVLAAFERRNEESGSGDFELFRDVTQYEVHLSTDGQLGIRSQSHREAELRRSPWYEELSWSGWNDELLASLDDVIICFDFVGSYDRQTHRGTELSTYPRDVFSQLERQLKVGYKFPGYVTRTHKKGYGLLTKLQAILNAGVA